jgi:hypothetical protein
MRAVLLLSLFTLGCSSTPSQNNASLGALDFVSTYTHPSYGEVKDSDPRLNSDREACRSETYSEGVMVNGQLIKGQAALNKIESDFRLSFVKEQLKTNKKMPSEDQVMQDAITHASGAPAYISEIRNKQKEFVNCFTVTKQYKIIKTETYDRKTGKLISTVQH